MFDSHIASLHTPVRVVRTKSFVRALSVLLFGLLLASVLGNSIASPALAAPAGADSSNSVKLGFFYNAPGDGTSTSTIASKMSYVIASGTTWRDDLRGAGYNGTIMRYFLGNEVEGPGPYKNSSASCNSSYEPRGNQVAYNKGDFCKYVHQNESWFLHKSNGERLMDKLADGRYIYYMNPGNSGWRSFARSRMAATVPGYTGIHLDNIDLNLNKPKRSLDNSDGTIKEYSSDDAYRNAIAGYLGYLKEMDGTLWINVLNDRLNGSDWDLYLPKVDGVMHEAWATGYQPLSVSQWEASLKQAATALAQGKGVLLVGRGDKGDTTKQRFALASYLLIANSKANFRYSNSSAYREWWDYSNYSVKLGTVKGDRYKSGSLWRRDFSCGYVTVDPAARTGNIVETCK